MQVLGYILIGIAGVALIAGILYPIIAKMSVKRQKADLPKTKEDGDNIKVRFCVEGEITVLTITKEKKVTYKGKEVTSQVNSIYPILSKDEVLYFYVAYESQLYKLTGKKVVPVGAKSDDDWDDDDWDD